MSRLLAYAGPLICLLVAAWTFFTLHLGAQTAWVLVGLDRVVGPDPAVQAAWTWRLMLAVGIGWGLGLVAWRRRVSSTD